ncbi:MAG: HlyC/CorC family transporter, partial [Calditrichaeota bacterium]|nr:HlyC/CorC family transporter [Calditrichota bacterium]
LALSAFFSSVESAYFSLSRTLLEQLGASADPRAKRVARMMNNPRRMLATILAGNTIVNTAAAAITALIAVDLAVEFGYDIRVAVTVEIILITIVILFFSELIPKLLALRNPEKWAVTSSRVVEFSSFIFFPLAYPLSRLTELLSHALGVEKHAVLGMSEEEIRALVQIGHERGELDTEEREMIHSIFEFGETTVRQVMVPRIDMITVERDDSFETIVDTIVKCGHSRIPVYQEKVDNIVGLIYAKDLLSVASDSGSFSIDKLLRTPIYIPEEKKIDDLLTEFKTQKIHIAMVVDEYGGTAGLVTMEDIIEEIVGEIQDEYDEEQPPFQRVDENTIISDGKVSVDDLNEEIGFELIPDSEAYDTVAGFVYSQLGEVPDRGQQFEFEGYRITVEEVINKRITRVRIEKIGGIFEDV